MTRTEYQTAPAAPFNGHPSYDHWNVALWVANKETLYFWAIACDTGEQFADELEAADLFRTTGDGVTVTRELAVYAWECVNEE